MQPRSWLFVPADSDRKIKKALESKADAIIFDLEDSVSEGNKSFARDLLKNLEPSGGPERWIRINPVGTKFHDEDVNFIKAATISGIVLPKVESGSDVARIATQVGAIPIHAIVTETAASLFNLLSYRGSSPTLRAMSWGAEDLSAALGAASKYDRSGELSFTYKLARSLCLVGASAAGVQPVDQVFVDFRDEAGLKAQAEAAAREGFTGKLAIHPAQVPIINHAFLPSADDVHHAGEIVAAFEAHPNAGVVSVAGKMVDRPHLLQAQRVLERASYGGD